MIMTRIIHYVSMSLYVVRPKRHHPLLESFTFRRYFA